MVCKACYHHIEICWMTSTQAYSKACACTAGQVRGEGTSSPFNVYGAEPLAPKPAPPTVSAAPEDVQGASAPKQLQRDLSDANLGLLEVPNESIEHPEPQSEHLKFIRSLMEQSGQQDQPGQKGTPAALGQILRPQPGSEVPAGLQSSLQGLQQPLPSQQQQLQQRQKLYSGPGTVAPPPSALPHPSGLALAPASGSYSDLIRAQGQANTANGQALGSYHDLLAPRGPPNAGFVMPAHLSARAQGPLSTPSGQSGLWPATGVASQIAAPDNSAGLNTWQGIADGQRATSGVGAGSTATAEAAAAGPSGLPGQQAKTGASFMREGESTGGAGGFLGRDLFANQRTELSRRASPASMWEAADQSGANGLQAQMQTPGEHYDMPVLLCLPQLVCIAPIVVTPGAAAFAVPSCSPCLCQDGFLLLC